MEASENMKKGKQSTETVLCYLWEQGCVPALIAALSEWKGISLVTLHHYHPPCRQQPQLCPCIPTPTRIVPENPHRRVKKPTRFPGIPFQMCRRRQQGQAEMKGETRETEPVGPKSPQPAFALPAGPALRVLLASQGNRRVGGGWGVGGVRVTSGSVILNKE